MTLPDELAALRTTVALVRDGWTSLLRVRGESARDAILQLLPSRLYLRDAQARESLLLREDGTPIADVLVCADDEDYLLLVDGLSPDELRAHIEANLLPTLAPTIEELSSTHAVISLHGPWAWELVAHVLGQDFVALPYLNFFRIEQGYCVRAGRTGEYGYDLVVRRDAIEELTQTFLTSGAEWRIADASTETFSLCRFENWFFDPRHVPASVTPLELQLSWRLDASRAWVGRDAVDARRGKIARRLTCLVSAGEIRKGDEVRCGDRTIGEVIRSAYSPLREDHIAAALLDLDYAHGAIDRYTAGGVRVRTMAPPLVDNRSLAVDPRRHSYREVDEIQFGPLVRGPGAPGEES